MINSIMLSGLLLIGGQPIDFPKVWQKIEGKWSYVGQVKEKELSMIFKNKKIEVKKSSDAIYNVFVEYECRGKKSGISTTKTHNTKILNKEIKKMPFITLSPKGEVLNLEPLH